MGKTWRIGTRGSKLALWQANFVKSQLEDHGHSCEIKIIKTQGDRVQDLSFDKLEGKGFFTSELEENLSSNAIDLAVHSLKDLPTEKHETLKIAALTQRANPSDVLIVRKEKIDDSKILRLAEGANVGTSSLRRQSLLRDVRSDIQCSQLRGNVPTRIRKLHDGAYDAIVLAQAGVDRLKIDLKDFTCWTLSPREFVPAAGQGVVAIQIRREDSACASAVGNLHHSLVAKCTNVERKVLQLMDGGCHIPLGVYCESDPLNNFHVWAAWHPPGGNMRRVKVSLGTTHDLAQEVVRLLKEDDQI